jgi:acyl-CoA thioester hydrolase
VARIFHKPLTVGDASIDALGHVNNREYLRWMEEVALEHSAVRGWPMQRYLAAGMAWVAATHFIEYLRPALAGEPIDVYTWIVRWGERDCVRRYAVLRQRKLLARGETLWTFVDLASGRARPIPPEVLGAYVAVGEDDEELRALGLVRRERRAARAEVA